MTTSGGSRSYRLRVFVGDSDGNGANGGTFHAESTLVSKVQGVHDQLEDGLTPGDAEIWVYRGEPPDAGSRNQAVTVGKMDACHVLLDEGVNEEKLDDLS